jgi:transposase
MMGQLPAGQNQLFYDLCLGSYVPEKHILRALDRFLDFGQIREHLAPFYSTIGRPSIDPELMVRMLLVGYCFGLRSERRLCEEVHLNLAYRWFCRLGLEDQVPNHSTFSKNRHGRFRDCELFRSVFGSVVERCIYEGLVGGEGFAVDASIIKADANRARGFPGADGVEWERPGRKTRAVCEYLDALDNDERTINAHESTRKAISLTDSATCWTSASGGPAFYAYSTNYLVDIDPAIIVGAQASPSTLSEESKAARAMIDRVEARHGLKPERFIGDTAYGNAKMLGWLVEDKQITPHVPVLDKSSVKDGQLGRKDFIWEPAADRYTCPTGKHLERHRRPFKNARTGITKDNTIIYRASLHDCEPCALKATCCPNVLARKIPRSVHEDARDLARSLTTTTAYAQSRNDRKKVEMLFAHLKAIFRFVRLRLRGPSGAEDEFLLAATVQNLKKLAKLVTPPPLSALATT